MKVIKLKPCSFCGEIPNSWTIYRTTANGEIPYAQGINCCEKFANSTQEEFTDYIRSCENESN
jgi:hypothetical protein